MPDLPQKKVGIVACSGEELPEGTVSRLAALRILEDLRPAETVTICLPLFLAGGEGDRAFARFYPTVTIDGCQEKCAARATERYSGKPAASLVVSEIRARAGLDLPQGRRQLNQAGEAAVTATAAQVATIVDELLAARWSRREGKVVPEENLGATATELEPDISPCACGSGIPVQKVKIHGQVVSLVALPALFEEWWQSKKAPDPDLIPELLEAVKIYNPIPPDEDEAYGQAILREYQAFWKRQEAP